MLRKCRSINENPKYYAYYMYRIRYAVKNIVRNIAIYIRQQS